MNMLIHETRDCMFTAVFSQIKKTNYIIIRHNLQSLAYCKMKQKNNAL
jgi:hypothetical protein